MTDYEKVYDIENLYIAHKKARLGKQNKREVASETYCRQL